MKVGITFREPTGTHVPTIDELVAELGAAAAAGFHTAWCSQVFGLDALTVLAVAGRAVPGIELGTAIVPIYPRHPLALASQTLTVQHGVGGRLTLGVGTSHPFITRDMLGYAFDRPGRHMREYLTVLGPLLRGESVDYHGETVEAVGTVTVSETRAPSLLVAALGPQMLRIAGALADGTITWMTGPKTVASHIAPTITEAAAEAGRRSPRVVAGVVVCVTSDEQDARQRAGEHFAMAAHVPSYRAVLDREGADGPQDVIAAGDEEAVERQLTRYAEAGATELMAAPFGTPHERSRTLDFLATHAPGR